MDLDSHRKGKCTVIKTSTRQTIFLPVVGLVDPAKLQPADLVGVNKDSYLILDMLPAEYDSRVKVRLFSEPSICHSLYLLNELSATGHGSRREAI